MDIQQLLKQTIQAEASDLHLNVGKHPTLRMNGNLKALADFPVLSSTSAESLIFPILSTEQRSLFIANRELDFSYALPDGRFRINVYFERGNIAAALRLIPAKIRTIAQLQLPPILSEFTTMKQGFILVTGPTGHGKSTTLAALINQINQTRDCHVVTIEDPIEYIYPEGRAIISQREMHLDTHSWDMALRSALREDPDVVLVGEMRDYETIAAAITVAETGHLVFATLHTNSAAQTIDRIVDVFPANQQIQIRTQLASVIEGIISQRLLPEINGGRVPATELLLASPAVRNSIREGKTHLINNIILTSSEMGMITLESSLADLVLRGRIDIESAQQYALQPEALIHLLNGKKE